MLEGLNLPALAAAVEAYGAVVRVAVATTRGSVPREPGAAMLVWAGGQSGTIGGGALEWEAAAAARRLLAGGPWARQVMRQPLGPGLGQCCGGQVTLLLERYGPEEMAALAALDRTQPFVRPTVSGLPPDPDALAGASARRAARSGEAAPRLAAGSFAEPWAEPALPVWLYGAGHVGRAVVRVAEGLPLAITWVDTDPARFPDPVSPHATRLVAADPALAAAHAPAEAVHLVLTYSHALDLAICRAVLTRPHRHLGLIGSASKKARFLSRLREAGLTERQLARLHCPIGDRRLGKRPAAIALGAVAELLTLAEPACLEATA